jgi:hypothetical protein
MTVVCPACQHSRCIDCDVRSHCASDVEIEEEKVKIASSISRSSLGSTTSQLQHRREMPEMGSSSRSLSAPSTGQASDVFRTNVESQGPGFPLIEIGQGTEGYPIYILKQDLDADLISAWHRVLHNLCDRCERLGFPIGSIHLFRVGPTESDSSPTIIVNTSAPLDDTQREKLQYVISMPEGDLYRRDHFPSAFLEPLQLVFRQSRLRRSLDSSAHPLPPICEPRNRHFSPTPGTGASIGIKGSVNDTATLGCYILVDKTPMALTVDHLIPETCSDPVITHISEQDRQVLLTHLLRDKFTELLESTSHSCGLCDTLRKMEIESICSSDLTFELPVLPRSCPLCVELQSFLANQESLSQSRTLGEEFARSGRRFRRCGTGGLQEKREMDWALFEVNRDAAFSLPDQSTHCDELRWLWYMKPGAIVKSIGRTSGYQLGQISTTTSLIFHESYATQEWCIMKHPHTAIKDWIEGGIGVDGDSGGLIVDEESNAVYGMLWGRTGEGPATVTIFTPMDELMRDIRDEAKAQNVRVSDVCLLGGQQMLNPNEEFVIEKASMSPARLLEKMEELDLEEPTFILDSRRQSNTEQGQRRPFERYRGHYTASQTPGRSVPRQEQELEEHVGSEQWPGTHTYIRYALADEQE